MKQFKKRCEHRRHADKIVAEVVARHETNLLEHDILTRSWSTEAANQHLEYLKNVLIYVISKVDYSMFSQNVTSNRREQSLSKDRRKTESEGFNVVRKLMSKALSHYQWCVLMEKLSTQQDISHSKN